MSDTTELRDQICEDKSKRYHHGGIIPASLTSKNLGSVIFNISTILMKEEQVKKSYRV